MIEHMMKSVKLGVSKPSIQADSLDKHGKLSVVLDSRKRDDKLKTFSPIKASKSTHTPNLLSKKNGQSNNHFTFSKRQDELDINTTLSKRRSVSKNSAKDGRRSLNPPLSASSGVKKTDRVEKDSYKTEPYKKVNYNSRPERKLERNFNKVVNSIEGGKEEEENIKNIESKVEHEEYSKSKVESTSEISPSNKAISNTNLDSISISALLSQNNNIPITLNNLKQNIEGYEPSKHSLKSQQAIRAYSANTHQGIIRNYNEDRVSIILNIIKPSAFKGSSWPKCSFFGIYDGHGGSLCADFLRDNLHHFIIKEPNFPNEPVEAIKKGFENCEKEFIHKVALNEAGEVIDRSGSCALICLIIGDVVYFANVGDSRAIMSCNGGETIVPITIDHKPNEDNETKRIINYGGKIYQTQTLTKNLNIPHLNINNSANQILTGPYRVYPGRLSVSRTFGDVEAKLPKFGGLENVIIAHPDVFTFKITPNMDYVLLGCDGIFDQLSDKEVNECVWMTFNAPGRGKNIHSQSGVAVDMVIKTSLVRRTLDNVTCVLVCFENFEKMFNSSFDKTPKLNPLHYNSTECSTDTKTPKVQTTDTNETKSSLSTFKENKYNTLRSPKAMPASAKHKSQKTGGILDSIKDFSSNKDKKMSSYDTLSNNSFYKNDSRNNKIYKKISSNIDPVKLKINNNKDFMNKSQKKEIISGFNSTKNKHSSTSIDRRLKLIQKDKSVSRAANSSNINNNSTMNKSTDKSLSRIKKTQRLDFSENFSDSKFSDLKRKLGLPQDNVLSTKSKQKSKHKFN